MSRIGKGLWKNGKRQEGIRLFAMDFLDGEHVLLD